MTRLRIIYDDEGNRLAEFKDGELVYGAVPERTDTHFVMPDLPGYDSPIDGRWVEGRVQRREDLRRSGSRPWEGREQEAKEAARRKAYSEQRLDQAAERSARIGYAQLSPAARRILRGE